MASTEEKPGLSQLDIEEFSGWFDMFDKDNSGTIDKAEMKKVVAALGWNLPDEELETEMKKFDKNGDRVLDRDEYMALLESLRKDPKEEELELRQAFSYFDKGKTGFISLEKLRQVLAATGVVFTNRDTIAFKKMFSAIDENGDGNISVDEYVNFMLDKVKLSELQAQTQQMRF